MSAELHLNKRLAAKISLPNYNPNANRMNKISYFLILNAVSVKGVTYRQKKQYLHNELSNT